MSQESFYVKSESIVVRPIFVLLLGVVIGLVIGAAMPMIDAYKGGGYFVPAYQKCR